MSDISADTKQLAELIKRFETLNKKTKDFIAQFMVEEAERIIKEAAKRTPVQTGTLQKGWKVGDVMVGRNYVIVYILNPTEYATEIEYGHRIVRNGREVGWYNGRFMLRTSMDIVQRELNARFNRQYEKMGKKQVDAE